MNGFKIGIGIGLNYHGYAGKIKYIGGGGGDVDITDAVLLSGGQGAILLTDGSYLKLASTSKTTTRKTRSKKSSINKSYWNF